MRDLLFNYNFWLNSCPNLFLSHSCQKGLQKWFWIEFYVCFLLGNSLWVMRWNILEWFQNWRVYSNLITQQSMLLSKNSTSNRKEIKINTMCIINHNFIPIRQSLTQSSIPPHRKIYICIVSLFKYQTVLCAITIQSVRFSHTKFIL